MLLTLKSQAYLVELWMLGVQPPSHVSQSQCSETWWALHVIVKYIEYYNSRSCSSVKGIHDAVLCTCTHLLALDPMTNSMSVVNLSGFHFGPSFRMTSAGAFFDGVERLQQKTHSLFAVCTSGRNYGPGRRQSFGKHHGYGVRVYK